MRKLLIIVLTLALSSLCATAATIRVPADRPTIQAAINVAGDGDTVLVADGTYSGAGNRDIQLRGKAITLRSENGPENCVIEGQGSGYVLSITSGESWNTIISGLTISGGDTGILIDNSSPTIRNCVVENNRHGIKILETHLAIDKYYARPLIESSRVINNRYQGIFSEGRFSIVDSVVAGNGISGLEGNGGITIDSYIATIANCLISGNYTDGHGGGIYCGGSAEIINCTIVDNSAEDWGGGIYAGGNSDIEVENCIFTGNSAETGDQYALENNPYYGFFTISHSNVVGDTHVDSGYFFESGPGMIEEDPLFVSGPSGNFYLSQTAAGQGADSPCVDTGNPESLMIYGTSRTDSAPDAGVVDMGYHYRDPGEDLMPDTLILSGPAGYNDFVSSPMVVFTFTGTDGEYPPAALTYSWRSTGREWSDWSATTRVAVNGIDNTTESVFFEVRTRDPQGDIDTSPARKVFYYYNWTSAFDDYFERIAVGPGPGPGNPPLVRTGLGQWTAYSTTSHGVQLAAGDIDCDGDDEVITGPGPGEAYGPHVRCFSPDGTVVDNAGFLAYGTHKYGVKVAAGDVDGDGCDEIITGAGPGAVFGPHVRGWNWDGGPNTNPIPGISFMAFGTHKYGVNVACGDIDGDGIDEIITGAGPGSVFGAHVRGWRFDGISISPMSQVNWLAFGTPRWGVTVACGDLDADGRDEIITGAGPGQGFSSHVRAWDYDNMVVTQMPGVSFIAYPHGSYGVVVGAANLINYDPMEELITLPGPGPSNNAYLRVWLCGNGTVGLVYDNHGNFHAHDQWMTHGGNVAGSKNGWE